MGSGTLRRLQGRGEKSDAETQTEQGTSVCPDSSGLPYREDSVPDVATINSVVEASAVLEEVDSSKGRSCPKEWFDTLDSVDAAKLVTQINSETADAVPPNSAEESIATPDDQHDFVTPTLEATPSSHPTAHSAEPAAKVSKIPRRPGSKAAAVTTVPQSDHNDSGAVVKPKAKSSAASARGKGVSEAPSRIPTRHSRSKKAMSVPHPTGYGGACGDDGRPKLVKSGTVHYHDRISGIGSVNFESTSDLPSPGKTPQMTATMLTAIKDYTPSDTAKNCLPLKQGDMLRLQPHMHYPKGWMWVWHMKRQSFGFVPKNHVAYTYNTPPRERNRGSVEDAV
jgi:hypothetical protein